ncbi:MAG TPA: head GIN domain-containing protein [Allosphingosinicella sp.]|nr:head GIN domain-containing protein [Allosphingosinicella sp.]
MREAILGAAVLLGACTSAGGEDGGARVAAQRSFEVGAFDRISLSGSQDVVVTVGGAASVRAEGDSEALDRLEIAAEGGQLRIGSRARTGWKLFGRRRGITVHVTVPTLAGASVGGSGDMRIDRVESERFAASVAGSGDIHIGDLRAAEADFSIAGSGAIRAAGAARRIRTSVAGSGDLDLARLEAVDASVALTGSGDVRVRASGTAAVELRGSGDVAVAGPARCSVSKSGSGDVHCSG